MYLIGDGKAVRKELAGAFLSDHSQFIVDTGVSAGDKVVSEASMVRDGQPVSAVESAAKPDGVKAPGVTGGKGDIQPKAVSEKTAEEKK